MLKAIHVALLAVLPGDTQPPFLKKKIHSSHYLLIINNKIIKIHTNKRSL